MLHFARHIACSGLIIGLAAPTAHAAVLDFNNTNFPLDGNTTAQTFTDIDGTGINATFNVAANGNSQFFNGSPEFDTGIFSPGGVQVQIERSDGMVLTSSATLTISFSQLVEDVSFSIADIDRQNAGAVNDRFERVTILADGLTTGVTLSEGGGIDSFSIAGNVATGNADSPSGANVSVLDVGIAGPISSFTIDLENVPNSTALGGSLFVVSDVEFTAIPEPASLALVGLGGLCLMSRRRR